MAQSSSVRSSRSRSMSTETFPAIPNLNAVDVGTSALEQENSNMATSTMPSSTLSAPTEADSLPRLRVAYDLDANAAPNPKSAPQLVPSSLSPPPLSPGGSGVRRRSTRANTFRTVADFEDYERRPGWRPGAEPGIDPTMLDGPALHTECDITVVDFSRDHLHTHRLTNYELIQFMKQPQPDWARCRWINVNGLSWDVIQALGDRKNLHRLAIEDIMNIQNRTKVDWYPGHAFVIMTCLKLVLLVDDDSDDEGDTDESGKGIIHGAIKRLKRWTSGNRQTRTATVLESGIKSTGSSTSMEKLASPEPSSLDGLRTLQRYQAPNNTTRTEYMEEHSALADKGLAVSAEQVSMFITSDNTVISFFEQSADNVEEPILARLSSHTTILRSSCDASMLAQAIIDAIIDMAIPVSACYADIVGDLELDVLTHPEVKHTKSLHIIISEINKLVSFVSPIQGIISSLRDHKTKLSQEGVSRELQNPLGGVIISPVTCTYLGDVYDHCVVITESLAQTKETASQIISLIFNTIALQQNDTMKQLTFVTIVFLPLTFITGFFGMNFGTFPEATDKSSNYFWMIAVPVAIGTVALLMREVIYSSFITFFQRRHILGARKRKKRIDTARKRERRHLQFPKKT
ncbi:hypothetical protein F4808DRAFT_430658 [Astrocystis sublimbata]|nr:hypothetical protein F4808DRAFT_430658 [Astrocystis sublimbata]